MTLDTSDIPDFQKMSRLDGKGFLVLGAGRGIGRQAAHALTQAGARVVCVGRSAELTNKVAKEVGGFACLADVTRREDMERLFKEAKGHLGRIHGIVDIVAMSKGRPIGDITDTEWNWQFDVVLRHAFLAVQLGTPALAESGGGTITFVGSISGVIGMENQSAYGASKAALHHFVQTSAIELGPRNIRINAVAPGIIWAERMQQLLTKEQAAQLVAIHPLRRLARPEEVASTILFLASDLSRHMTAQTLVLDGGLSTSLYMPFTIAPSKGS